MFWSFPRLEIIHTHRFGHGKASKTHPCLVTSSNEEISFKLGHVVFALFFYTNFAIFSFHFFYPSLTKKQFFFLKKRKERGTY